MLKDRLFSSVTFFVFAFASWSKAKRYFLPEMPNNTSISLTIAYPCLFPGLRCVLGLQEPVLVHHDLPPPPARFLHHRVSHFTAGIRANGWVQKPVSHKNSKKSDARRPKPVGLRSKLISLWRDLRRKGQSASQYLSGGLSLAAYFVATVVALILWQPVTACCKFYRDSRYTRTDIDPNAQACFRSRK